MKKYILAICLCMFQGVSCMNPSAGSAQNLSLEDVRGCISDKIREIEVKCIGFDGLDRQIKIPVLDVVADSVIKIFEELYAIRFPIYMIMGYESRNIANMQKSSLHSFGLAIDVNEHINPSYKVMIGPESIDPSRSNKGVEADKDCIRTRLQYLGLSEGDIELALKHILQEEGSDDWFVNRVKIRLGMTTGQIAKIFFRNGFNVWGGLWRDPIDPMHFQCPRSFAEALVKTDSLEKRKEMWAKHLEACAVEPLPEELNYSNTKNLLPKPEKQE